MDIDLLGGGFLEGEGEEAAGVDGHGRSGRHAQWGAVGIREHHVARPQRLSPPQSPSRPNRIGPIHPEMDSTKTEFKLVAGVGLKSSAEQIDSFDHVIRLKLIIHCVCKCPSP